MKTNRSPKFALAAVGLAALAFVSTASAQYKAVGDDGIAASPKVRQMLNERKVSAAPAVALVPAMACPKCADVLTTAVNHQAKGGQLLAGTATQKLAHLRCLREPLGDGRDRQRKALGYDSQMHCGCPQ